jgi:hypothetical protein
MYHIWFNFRIIWPLYDMQINLNVNNSDKYLIVCYTGINCDKHLIVCYHCKTNSLSYNESSLIKALSLVSMNSELTSFRTSGHFGPLIIFHEQKGEIRALMELLCLLNLRKSFEFNCPDI